ncbi:hypothetical protein B0I75DRAFT_136991 [Yarrowia lipolytica]|uniref:Uncharacterized protein n=1 Tax=Yarrowia lipolytica TaxID=4952 RepID=A0A1D8NGG4_YARLL|nr:hypothetical protein YALI1_D36035g [Yarrowia lipolytica]KAB8283994.1 hypothetical protein BKA91DRAFT_136021 [Yarrowia lipolytica]KAE8172173.1 hypothetical protein BKA90DRAFT_137897 [Yarrowia lipolytica]RDW46704.1 hypothetical protein B0I74DRAFT_136651 [Yarrowia lipolytica]RDW53050.1 hypothetical protein B0I75DRAFT_136991 [Yarrowia lipolytica]
MNHLCSSSHLSSNLHPNNSCDSTMDCDKHKRLRDEGDDAFDFYEEYEHLRPQKIRPTSMAKIMNLTLHNLELLHFFVENTGPMLVQVTGERDSRWMGAAPQLSMSSRALSQACQVFAEAHKFHKQNPYRYLLEGETPYPKSKGKPKDMGRVIGYVPVSDKHLEQQMLGFTKCLKTLRMEIEKLDETANFDRVLTAAVIVSLCAMGSTSFVPLVNFEGKGDLFSVLRIINDIQSIYNYRLNERDISMVALTHRVPLPNRLQLPHEDELRSIVGLVNGVGAEERRVRGILEREIHTLVELYNMDIESKSVAHMVAWCVYWQPGFSELKEKRNHYALLVICFWCAYVHRYHALFWWGDRLQEDLYNIVDRLPQHLIQYVEWPLRAVMNFEYDHLEWIQKNSS